MGLKNAPNVVTPPGGVNHCLILVSGIPFTDVQNVTINGIRIIRMKFFKEYEEMVVTSRPSPGAITERHLLY